MNLFFQYYIQMLKRRKELSGGVQYEVALSEPEGAYIMGRQNMSTTMKVIRIFDHSHEK